MRAGVSHQWPADPWAAALSARRRRPAAGDVCRRRWPACSAARAAGRWWSPAMARCSIASDLEVPLSLAASLVVPVVLRLQAPVMVSPGGVLWVWEKPWPVWPARRRRRPWAPLSFMKVQVTVQSTHPDPLPVESLQSSSDLVATALFAP
ncbi:hypothetical protein VPH35_059596 [Triticum aestivum]